MCGILSPGRKRVLGACRTISQVRQTDAGRDCKGLVANAALGSADSLSLTARGSGQRPDEWASGTKGVKPPKCHLLSE